MSSNLQVVAGPLGSNPVGLLQLPVTERRTVATGSTSVSDDTDMPSVKRPFAACGKLTSILDESAETQGVHNYDWTRWSRFFTMFRSHSE